MDISDIRRANLRSLIEEAGSRQLFIERTGKSDAQISQLLSTKKTGRNIGSALAREFEDKMGKPRGWMDSVTPAAFTAIINRAISGDDDDGDELDHRSPEDYEAAAYFEAPHLFPEAELIGLLDLWDSNTPLTKDEVALPLFSEVEMAAGPGVTEVKEVPGKKLRFARSTLRRAGVTPEYAACAIVRGNSMEPMMPDGACIGIDTADHEIRDGKIYALDHGGMLRVKMLYRRPGGGLRLVSLNSEEHPAEEYPLDYVKDHIKIKGRVFWYSGLL